MARQLWVLRHAEAEPHGTRADAERRLTARGEGQARTAGIALQRLGASFDVVLFSPKARAQATAELAAAEWKGAQRGLLRAYPPLAGGFDAQRAVASHHRVAPQARVDLLALEHAPVGRCKELYQLELAPREVEAGVAHEGLELVHADLHLARQQRL